MYHPLTFNLVGLFSAVSYIPSSKKYVKFEKYVKSRHKVWNKIELSNIEQSKESLSTRVTSSIDPIQIVVLLKR